MSARGFTLMEMTIVLVVGTILTTAGMVSATTLIKEARYRADRSRLYKDVKQLRDRANKSMRGVMIQEGDATGTSRTTVHFVLVDNCIARTPDPTTEVFIDYPTIDHNFDRGFCHDRSMTLGMNGYPSVFPSGSRMLDFIEMGGGGAPDIIDAKDDGRLGDNWGEFPVEGALDASRCDPDEDLPIPCGD